MKSGRGVKQDFAQALVWLQQSAKQGNADAENLLGQMHQDGKGTPQDYVEAAKWFRATCEHRPDYGGAGQGCNNLGLLYLDGRGVQQSNIQAYKYFKLSRSPDLAAVKSQMTASEIAEADRQTEQWLKAHPDQ